MRHFCTPLSLLKAGALGLVIVVATASVATGTATTNSQAAARADSLRDPALRTGTLPNGMRYYVRQNKAPAQRAYLWLAVNAGSLLEDDDQRGLAHFLEHMAFNGTTHFPRNSLIDFVETSGMQFGPDLNASTSFDETIYKLTVPTDDPLLLQQGLQVVEDWASGGITIDSLEVVAERGVVMGEWRTRALLDSVSERLQEHHLQVLFGDSRYASRLPIGLPALLESANPAPLKRFYRDWYRPDLMAVIAVGDFDPDAMEREIRERFGRIQPPDNPRPRIQDVLPVSAEPVVNIVRDKVWPRIEVEWPAPPPPQGVREGVQQEVVSALLLQHFQRKLLRIREQSSRPFVNAVVRRGRIVRPAEVVAVQIVAQPDSLERALAVILSEVERVAQHGVPQAALERQKAALLRRLTSQTASEAARSSGAFVSEYTRHYLSGEGYLLSATQELELVRDILPAITPEVLAQAAQFWREREGLKVLVHVPQFALGFPPPTRESVLALFDSVGNTALAPENTQPAVAADVPLLDRPPVPGKVVKETRHAKAGVTEWTLSNGARVLFKPSGNDPDELLIRAWSPGGFSLVPDSLFFTSGRMVGHMMTEAAGLGEQDRDELIEQLATTGVRPLRVDIGYADESVELGGSPKELETLFQLLHLQFTAPKLDSAALATWANVAKYQRRSVTIHDQFNQTFARGNARLAPVQTRTAELARVEEALAVYEDRFGNAGDFTFTLVGAATAEQVKPLVERYIASLPATSEREAPKDPEVRPFARKIEERFKVMPVPRSQTLLVFDGSFPADPPAFLKERERLSMLVLVLQRRLRDRLREQLGGTYGVSTSGGTYLLYDERYRVIITFQSAPERMAELNREMLAIIDSVRTHGATAPEVARLATVQRRQLETQLQSNDFWIQRLGLFDRLNVPLDRIVEPYSESSVTPAELAVAARRYLPEGVYIHVTEMPKDTSYANRDSAGRSP